MPPDPGGARAGSPDAFEVTLSNFTGPFDLLLSLITKHRLDITEIALAEVTDEFLAHMAALDEWDLSRASEFLVVAATLLDLKAARLLPRGDVESEEDLELLEARDLLFARLLAYRAFRQVADHLAALGREAAQRFPRSVPLEPHFAALLPELVLSVGPEGLAALAARALQPRPEPPGVELGHLHDPVVSVREQADVIMTVLRRGRVVAFRRLVADAASTAVIVARFLALLELFREGAVAFEQAQPLGELEVRWTGGDAEFRVGDDYDDDAVAGPPDAGTADSGPRDEEGHGDG
ncbi:MAG: segregation/condensation protein A [Actinomycetales bacterium]|nr:segregation/condensation protein A [Actinomycetales bacterium]